MCVCVCLYVCMYWLGQKVCLASSIRSYKNLYELFGHPNTYLLCPQCHFQTLISYPFPKDSSSSEDHAIRQYFSTNFLVFPYCSLQNNGFWLTYFYILHWSVLLNIWEERSADLWSSLSVYFSSLVLCPINSICLRLP